MTNDWFGKELILTENVKYVGEGEDPAQNPYMIAYSKALKEVYGKITDEMAKDDPNSGNWLK